MSRSKAATVALWVSWPWVAASWRILEQSPDPGGLARYPVKALILVALWLLVAQGLSELIKRVAALSAPHGVDETAP